MKLFLLLIASCALLGTTNALGKDTIYNLLNTLRHKLICAHLNHIEEIPLNVNNENIRADMNLTDLFVHGATDFKVTVHAMIPIRFTLEWPNPLTVSTSYKGSASLFNMLNLYGDGEISLTINKLKLPNIVIFLGADDDNMVVITNMQVPEIQLEPKAKITGLFNDEVLSALITEELLDVLKLAVADISGIFPLLKPILLNLINSQITTSYDDLDGPSEPLPPCVVN